MFNFKVFQELAFYSHATFKAHLLGLLGQHFFTFQGMLLEYSVWIRCTFQNFPEFSWTEFGNFESGLQLDACWYAVRDWLDWLLCNENGSGSQDQQEPCRKHTICWTASLALRRRVRRGAARPA